MKKFSGERLRQSGVHLPKFLIFAFSWLQSRRKNLNFHAGKTLSLCHNHCFVLLFFSNLNWFTMPPLMTDSLLIFFLCVSLFSRFSQDTCQKVRRLLLLILESHAAAASLLFSVTISTYHSIISPISPLRFNVDIWTWKHQISAASSKDAGDGHNNMRKQYYYIGCYGLQWQWKANIHEKCTKKGLF